MPREKDVRRIRELLQRRRRDLLEAHEGARRELTALKEQERDPEYEEGAQSELADYTLSALLESQRIELRMIDAALQRMDAGEYGECVTAAKSSRSNASKRFRSRSAARWMPHATNRIAQAAASSLRLFSSWAVVEPPGQWSRCCHAAIFRGMRAKLP